MMERYPKFLNTSPKFWGLTLSDIVLFALALNVFYHVGVPVFGALVVAFSFALLRRVAIKWIDFKSLLVSFPSTHSLNWSELSGDWQDEGGRQ